LPPTILSPAAAERGLAVSLMERIVGLYGSTVARLLTVQYRMHTAIMGFPNAEFYGGRLAADPSVSGRRLCEEPPVRFVDTAGAGFDEEPEPDGGSRRNPREADTAARAVRRLRAAGVSAGAIGVITPYRGQVRLLRDLLADEEEVEVDSVDGFQGREKDAVVVSLVRSNAEGDIGFLADTRRTNVALTRARSCLVVVGDSATLSHDPFYRRMVAHFDSIGAYTSVWNEAE
jgi:superfamily I DNA and/or RNA helicase